MASIDTVINQTMINQTMMNQTMINQTMINQTLLNQYNVYATVVQQINNKTEQTTSVMQQAGAATDKLNGELNKTGTKASSASAGLGKILNMSKMITKAVKGMKIADKYTNIMGRIGLVEDVNKGLQTQAQLQDKIFAASNRARGSYLDMADTVVDLELLAGDAFGSSDETIAFAELAQKSFKLGGTDPSAQKSAMDKMTQSMASGQLKGGDFDSIMGNAPMLYDAIAKYTGLSKGELKKLAADSGIAADVIKNSLFMASNNINDEFAGMPVTFANIWERIKNGALWAFGPIIEKVSELIKTESFMGFVDKLIAGMSMVAGVISGVIDAIINGWNVIGPILGIIGGILLADMIVQLWKTIPPIITQAAAWMMNYWPLLLVIGAIALAIFIARKMGATWEDIFGFIGGVIGVFVAFFYNQFVKLWNFVAAFANFFGNFLNNPAAAIKTLILDLVINLLGFIGKLTHGIQELLNKIPGVSVDLTANGDKLLQMLKDESQRIKEEADFKEFVKTLDYTDYSDAYGKASDMAKDTVKKIEGYKGLDGLAGDKGTEFNPTVIKGLGSGGKVEVDMAKEDLKYLRDIAEREYINKFSTATLAPNVQISFGDVHETADIDKLKGTLERMMREEIAVAAEGVF